MLIQTGRNAEKVVTDEAQRTAALLEHPLRVSMSMCLLGAIVIDVILLFREIKTPYKS